MAVAKLDSRPQGRSNLGERERPAAEPYAGLARLVDSFPYCAAATSMSACHIPSPLNGFMADHS